MIVVIDRNYRYRIANRAFLQYRNMIPKAVIGHHVTEILNPTVFEKVIKEKLDECFHGTVVRYEMSYVYPDCGERQLLIQYSPIYGPGGIDRAACVIRDVTNRKQAEHSLELFRTLIDQSNDAVEVVDPHTMQFLDVNDKACKDLGYSREELLGMTVFDIDPGSPSSLAEFSAEGSIVKEAIHRRKDGSTFPVEVSIRYVELNRSYFVAVARDITDRKKRVRSARERRPIP